MNGWTYTPEALEEHLRVTTVRRFCLPERWFVPAPVELSRYRTSGTPRRRHGARVFRRLRRGADCHLLKNTGGRFREVSTDLVELVPVRIPCGDKATAIVELVERDPNNLWVVFKKAYLEENQEVLAALIEAAAQLTGATKAAVAKELRKFPDHRFTEHLRAVLA